MTAYMRAQKKRIEMDKWLEGCRSKHDPGEEYVFNWITTNGAWFRSAWEKALCSGCAHVEHCGYKLYLSCDEFSSLEKKDR